MNSLRTRRVSERGLTSIEIVVAMAILASVCVFAGAYLHTIVRRERMKGAVREVYSLVLATRMQAVRRDSNVVLRVDLADRELTSWADAPPANFVRDDSEPILIAYRLPTWLVVRSVSGPVDGPDGVAFDEYDGDASLVDRIVFRGDGSLVQPQGTNSQVPARPSTYTGNVPSLSVNCPAAGCRGIFLADRPDAGPDRNLFRISVDDFGRIGKTSLLKWLPPEHGGNSGERDFVPSPWKWVD